MAIYFVSTMCIWVNAYGSLNGHEVGSKAYARYRDIYEDMKKELVTLLD